MSRTSTSLQWSLLGLAAAAATALAPAAALAQAAQAPAATTAKKPITRADELPRRTYTLPKLPSELLTAPLAELAPVADILEKDVLADLAAFDIQDTATLRGMHGVLMQSAMLRGDLAEVKKQVARMRALQEKPGLRLTTGLAGEAVAEVRAGGGDAAQQAARLRSMLDQRLAALPWADVEAELKSTKAAFETMNPSLTVQAFREQLDVMARNGNLQVPAGVISAIVASRVNLDQVAPLRQTLLAAFAAVVDKNVAAAPSRPDRWTERTLALAPSVKASPVVMAIWDSGVDMNLFKAANEPARRGLAFEFDGGNASPDLLRPLGDAKERWPQIRSFIKGAFDMQSALDTEDSRRLRQAIATLKPEELKRFQEDMAVGSLYTHGTHVAGIAVDGNPFASVFAVSMHFSHKAEPTKPTAERSQRIAAAYQNAVDAMKAAGVRVVNMSWRYGPQAYEGALTFHNVGANADERKRLAMQLFATERDALRAAMASAPNILFVAGSGNENNSADFSEYIPAGLELPNLITVGAVDKSGEETAFSTFGRTVVVHANGFEVDSLLPGGDRARFSGTSMASPQVANLAGKMLALNPALTAAQVKERILANAERSGRVNLINPRVTLAALGAPLPAR